MLTIKPLALLKQSVTSVPKVVKKGGDPLASLGRKGWELLKRAAARIKKHWLIILLLSAVVIIGYYLSAGDLISNYTEQEQQITVETTPASKTEETARPIPDLTGSSTLPTLTGQASGADAAVMEVLSWPVTGETVKAFGFAYSSTFGDYRYHKGIDIQSPQGEEVAAIADGTVEEAVTGLRVVIDHGKGWISIYEGIGEAGVTEGQQVERGTAIAVIGSPPREETSIGTHLHLEVALDGEAQDPLELLKAR